MKIILSNLFEERLDVLIPEGRHKCLIATVEATKSKKGDDYLTIDFIVQDVDGAVHKEWFSLVTGKRWSLKKLLTALNMTKSTDHETTIETDNMIGQFVICEFYHDTRDYINKDGVASKIKKNKITGFFPCVGE
jgi:hypothetical protein